jgi:NOL1/NOP2/sun family putative RNA methylase
MESFSHERRGSFRLNLLKTDGAEVMTEFGEKGIVIEEYPGISGVYVFDRIHEYAIKWTRAFYDGKIYLQGIASMLPVLALDPKSGESVLDICAAPGSKTTQLAMLMRNEWSITALEQNQIRYDKLMHNCKLQWVTIVEGEKIDARKYLTEISWEFDKILLDAPCSAEGRILLSNEKSYGFWSLENTKKKAELQYELFSNAIKLLKSGGTFIYSTCTLAPEENEWVVARILEENKSLELQDIDIWLSEKSWWKPGMTTFGGKLYPDKLKKTVRILPSDETEGFYMAKIRKI